MQPSEFWTLSPQEWWWEFDARVETNKRIEKRVKSGGKFEGPEWDEARRKHKAKMEAKHGRPSAA